MLSILIGHYLEETAWLLQDISKNFVNLTMKKLGKIWQTAFPCCNRCGSTLMLTVRIKSPCICHTTANMLKGIRKSVTLKFTWPCFDYKIRNNLQQTTTKVFSVRFRDWVAYRDHPYLWKQFKKSQSVIERHRTNFQKRMYRSLKRILCMFDSVVWSPYVTQSRNLTLCVYM